MFSVGDGDPGERGNSINQSWNRLGDGSINFLLLRAVALFFSLSGKWERSVEDWVTDETRESFLMWWPGLGLLVIPIQSSVFIPVFFLCDQKHSFS